MRLVFEAPLLFTVCVIVSGYCLRPCCSLQFLCLYPVTVWGPAALYSFCACIRLLFEALPLFAVSVLVSGYCLRPYRSLQFLCFYPVTVWGPATVYSFCTCIPLLFEALLLFTVFVLVSGYCLRPYCSLQFLCLYPVTVWGPATVYSFLCLYPVTVWGPATMYSFCACIRLLFEALLLFTVSVFASGYCLRPCYYVQFLCLYPVTVWGPATFIYYILSVREASQLLSVAFNTLMTRWRSWLRHYATGRRSWVCFPMKFFNWSNPSSCTMTLGSTQTVTEMSTRDLSGSEGRPARKPDLTSICERIVWKMWEPGRLTTLWATTPVTWIALPTFYLTI
jgi:hypothetical protein